ncbi:MULTISPECIES: MotA/TolQ/ExbB proton channel family protein [Rhizobium/Agrobacterium group]|uniref:MotA/TolQ/ExbB proton channel family protein n=1 Tax=Rhizobium/Agrobacterium group TaxID=227290 RepID=UPI0022C7D52B|nr:MULTISPECIES: MotA/TolQ/ExbB proton channel family protein [Rhizobium/Agrobacterium group]MCZ7482879.1 MotA/TolQ/ExbB proton channel family protein [Rhizobium rhizogenes]MDA5635012.1 MotA/TolQ/ExbB proton channel family protein [Agrobacterium sp. ST15.16.024]MDF1890160.1 MotA/TolQ/ExbB proton channel family protein [Rhizobium rhizogenes]MDO3444954.1 MotA/TolQ/ExbB proton channel family protein [Agrobacterium sp. V1]
MNSLELSLYEASRLFLFPILLLIAAALAYAFVSLGMFLAEALQRWRGSHRTVLEAGHSDDIELAIMKRLELLRIVSRTAPMLGLVATMIPMGPALLGLGRGDAASVGENLVVAFSSVILALVAASITFFILTIRRRWLLEELRVIERARGVV